MQGWPYLSSPLMYLLRLKKKQGAITLNPDKQLVEVHLLAKERMFPETNGFGNEENMTPQEKARLSWYDIAECSFPTISMNACYERKSSSFRHHCLWAGRDDMPSLGVKEKVE
ncbi:MAG: hypothetical protein N2253_03275 [Bacteroidia bacterium]|nr:hypothetical protein [Bacteroidia bacterium]MCX7763900.1 hypothetical protein [Bacteroidia bacterium]MDW8057686.1 hypothetical protein [Bacteroidia bacterium]